MSYRLAAANGAPLSGTAALPTQSMTVTFAANGGTPKVQHSGGDDQPGKPPSLADGMTARFAKK